MNGLASVMRDNDWARLPEYFHSDAVLEYPQSGSDSGGSPIFVHSSRTTRSWALGRASSKK
jgi:hypothetical protein